MNTSTDTTNKQLSYSSHRYIPKNQDAGIYEQLHNHKDRMKKILAALYMLTNLLDNNDPLSKTIRVSGTEALMAIHNLIAGSTDTTSDLQVFYHRLNEINSYLDVAHKNKFFSDMNYRVVSQEIYNLSSVVADNLASVHNESPQGNNLNTINDLFTGNNFNSSAQPSKKILTEKISGNTKNDSDDISESHLKDTPVFVQKQTIPKPFVNTLTKKTSEPTLKKTGRKSKPKSNQIKDTRKENIIKILKQKKDASINDICALFKDCSSKTIQRDLIELIEENKVVKHGSRRWSTYNLA